jgi:hypothetical protein
MRALSIFITLALAVPWSLAHMANQSHLPDSLGIRAVLAPLAYFLACGFFFFLLWTPVLAICICLGSVRRDKSDRNKALVTLFLSLIPFVICLALFLSTPAMARYR